MTRIAELPTQAVRDEQKLCAIDRIGDLLLRIARPERGAEVDAIMIEIIRLAGADEALDDCLGQEATGPLL